MITLNHDRLFTLMAIVGLIAAFFALGCGGESGSETSLLPDGEQVFTVEGGTLEITAMSVLVAEIEFEAEGPDTLDISREGPYDIDVIKGVSTPDYPLFELGVGTWSDFYLGVELYDNNSGRSAIELEALFHSEEGVTEVQFLFDSGEVFEPSFPATINLDSPLPVDIVRVFHPSKWFPTIDLRDATVNDNNVIVLSQSSNVGIFNDVADALDRATETVTAATFREE